MMRCAYPIVLPHAASVPCGQCMPCRINKRRAWTARLLLEHAASECASFVTLTYSEENLPDGHGTPVLDTRDTQLWLKRLRKAWPGTLRYFLCGEYGSRTFRPHYHAVLFGLPTDPDSEALVGRTWGMGFVSISELNASRAAYVAQYTAKKWTRKDHPKLAGRPPEFMRSSRRPGIGYPALEYLIDRHHTRAGASALASSGDVIPEIRHDGRRYPLDAYMREKLRQSLDVPALARDRPSKPAVPGLSERAMQSLREFDIVASEQAQNHGVL